MARGRAGFTTRASCLLAAGLTAVLCGLLLGETDLIRAGVLAAAVPCTAALIVHRSRVQVANRRGVDPSRVQAGQAVTVQLTVTNRSKLPTGPLMLEDQLPDKLHGRARFVLDSLGGQEVRQVSYRMPDLGRGRYRVGPLSIRITDPFRMIDLTRSFTASSEFVVAPIVDVIPAIDPSRSDELGDSAGSHSVGSHGADDASTREYRTGDDLRKIHWRSSARTGVLMVRQEERPWRSQSTFLLDLRAGAHGSVPDSYAPTLTDCRERSSLEWAVSAVASLGAQASRQGRDVGLIADPAQNQRLTFTDATVLATHLAGVRTSRVNHLTASTGLIRTAARDSALIAVLGRLDPPTLRLLADAHPRGRSSPALALLLDVDSWTVVDDEYLPDLSGPSQGSAPSSVRVSAEVLRNAGWRVHVVRRGVGTPQAWRSLMSRGLTPTHTVGMTR